MPNHLHRAGSAQHHRRFAKEDTGAIRRAVIRENVLRGFVVSPLRVLLLGGEPRSVEAIVVRGAFHSDQRFVSSRQQIRKAGSAELNNVAVERQVERRFADSGKRQLEDLLHLPAAEARLWDAPKAAGDQETILVQELNRKIGSRGAD